MSPFLLSALLLVPPPPTPAAWQRAVMPGGHVRMVYGWRHGATVSWHEQDQPVHRVHATSPPEFVAGGRCYGGMCPLRREAPR